MRRTVDETVLQNPELRRRLIEMGVDYCWGVIDSSSVKEIEGETEWFALDDDDLETLSDEIEVLIDLSLAEQHATNVNWIRVIASL